MADKKRWWTRRLVKVAAALAALLIALAAAGKWWIIPALIRREFQRQLPEYWDGEGEIGAIHFAYFGPLVLKKVELRDRRGQTWLATEEIKVELQDWPSLHPTIWSAVFFTPTVTLHVQDGRCRPPLRKIASEFWLKYLALRELHFWNGTLEVREDGKGAGKWESLAATFQWNPAARRIHLHPPWGEPFAIEAVKVEGFVMADDRLAVKRLSGRVGQGRAWVSFDSQMGANGVWRMKGTISAMKLDLAPLRLPVAGLEKGLATGLMNLHLDGRDANGLTGVAAAFVEDADLRNIPAFAEVLRRAGMGRLDVLSDSDVEAHFKVHGRMLALDGARIHLPLAAVDIEPGGTLDVLTGRMGLTAVVVVFENVRDLLKRIPLVGLVVDLTDRLSRFRVEGKWQDPRGLVVAAAPLSGVRKGSKDFLTDAARGTSRFGKSVFNGLGGMLNAVDPNRTATKRAETQPAGP
jgi:hypothetical protein